MPTLELDRGDLEPHDEKALRSLSQFRIERVATSGLAFEEAYAALFAEFGERGEIERREVISSWLDRGASGQLFDRDERRVDWQFHLLVARDAAGTLAGVRDAHVTIDRERRECVVYLAHTLVLPEFRRGGLASLFRAAPVALARRAIAEALLTVADTDVLVAAEMEPAELDSPPTLVRLVAYGRTGFAAIPPFALPYCQPDFRDRSNATELARPLPLLPVVRWLGHAPPVTPSPSPLPARLAAAYARHLYAVFATHCRAADLARPLAHALDALARSALDPVPLVPLPASLDDAAAFAPLTREATLRHHLPELASPTPAPR